MLPDFQQGPFPEDEDLHNPASENPHQQALRALFAGNQPLFLSIITKHNMGRFRLPPYKVLAECLNIRESEAKLKYGKLFNQNFCEVLRASEIQGRFFAKPEQLSLHNYVKYQYLEERSRAKAYEGIAQAYMDIFKRISNIDDFVYFINLALNSAVHEPFALVEDKICQILSNSQEGAKDIELFKFKERVGDQEKLIFDYGMCVLAKLSAKKDGLGVIDEIMEKVHASLKNEPAKQLLAACLQLSLKDTIPEVFQLHPRELIEFDFKRNQCRLKSQYLHADLCGFATFKTYFRKMNELDQLVEKFEVIAHSAKLQEGKVLLGISYELLGDDQINTESKYTNKKVATKYITQFADFLHVISTHISSEFIVIGEENLSEQFYNIKYACRCFCVFAAMNKLRTAREHQLYEGLLVTWGRLFSKWAQIKEVAKEAYFDKAVEAYFSLIHSIERHQEFQPLATFQSEVSKAIYEILIKLEKYPLEISCFKGIKNVIFKWAMQNLPETQQLKSVVSKFISCFFDDKLVINSDFGVDLFETPAICASVKKAMSSEIIGTIANKIVKLQSQKINTSWHSNAYQYNQFFAKFGYIISSRILQSIEAFTNQMVKLYHKYAHVWPIMHSYRLWILQVCKEHTDFKYEQNLQVVVQLWTLLYQKLLDQCRQKKLVSANAMSKANLQLYEQFHVASNNFINSVFLKKIKDPITKQVFSKYIQFLFNLSQQLQELFIGQESDMTAISQWANQGFSIQKDLRKIEQQLLVNLRFWVCNSQRFLTITEEESIVRCMGEQMVKVSINNKKLQLPWKIICTGMGMNSFKSNSVLGTVQKIGALQRYTAKMNTRLENFVPFNFVSALYGSIRSNYKQVLKYIFSNLLEDQEKWEDLWHVLDNILFTPVAISGSCIFNGQTYEKAKEDMAFGIYYDQFQKLTELLTEGPNMAENVKIIVMLEKKKFFSTFYEILRAKTVKIVEKNMRGNPIEMRYRGRNMSPEEVISALGQMGVSRQQAEIALEHIDVPDHNLAMQWIDNNQQRIEELIMTRTMERTRQQSRRQPRKQAEVHGNQINALTYERFYDKEKMIKQSRNWIKVVFKELFKDENMESSQILKDLLFMFMDSLKTDQQQSQYTNLNDKLFTQIQELKKQKEINNRLLLYLIILEGSFAKTEKTKNDFFLKFINTTILSYLPRIQNPILIEKIFSLINSTLPVFTANDVITPQLQSYLSYLLDLVLKYRRNKKSFSEIMLKIAKSGKQVLMQRITRNLNVFFTQNLIKQNVFSLINILFESDKELACVNAELDLKTYLYERYRHRLANFQPDKEHVLEIDIKEYLNSFPKYEKGSAIYEVTIGMLAKKKNKNRYFYYDCRKQKNAFDYSHYGKCSFLKYPIKQHFKAVIRSLLTSLYQAKDAQNQEAIITDLYKLLSNYRILIPFTIHQQFFGKNLVDWLLLRENNSKRKFKFLTFLTLNANFFIHVEGYRFSSLSDYIIAKIITTILRSNRKNELWTSFAALYLSQVRRFSELSEANLSKADQLNLIKHYQQELEGCSPLEYINISEFLYVQYKRRIVDNLRRKYKFIQVQGEGVFDHQFLNISPFFNAVAVKKENAGKLELEVLQNVGELQQEEDQQSPEMISEEELDHRFLRRPQPLVAHQPQYEQLIVPLPQALPKEKQNKQKQEQKPVQNQKQLEPIVVKNWQYLQDIIVRFQKILHFDEQIDAEIELQEAVLPQQPIVFPNLNNGFKLNVIELNLDLDLRVKKLSGFQSRIGQIYAVIALKNNWETKKKETIEDRLAFMSLGRRLIDSLQNQRELGFAQNRQALLTLERFMQGRHNRQAAENPPPRNLNVNDIYQHLQEFTEAIVPVVEVVQPAPQIQLEPVPQIKQQAVSGQFLAAQPVGVQLIPSNLAQVGINVEQNQAQSVPPKQPQVQPQQKIQIQVPQDFQFEQIIPAVNQPQIQQEGNVPNIPQNDSQEDIHFADLEPANNPAPQHNLLVPQPNSQPIAEQQPPAIQRQILSMMGLAQTFLRDVGLDEEFFDSLPEDLQQEQLLQFMSQQGGTVNRRTSANNPNQGPPDQTSENVAFLESLDMQTRAQVLVEATPEFLATLPPNIREQAERYRHHQINRIIEEEEIEEERNLRSKGKEPLVYPVVKREEFSPISEAAARAIFLGVFNIYPKLKLSALKILLQNKRTQQKALSTLIALLNSFQSSQKQAKVAKLTKVETTGKQHKISSPLSLSHEDLSQIRIYVLHTILQHITIPLYKDDDFLMQKIGNQVFCKELAPFLKTEEIDPLLQLLNFALNYYPELATELLKKTKDLPQQLFQKLVEGIRRQSWPLQLYDSLQNFSENETLRRIFGDEFDQKAPSNKILSKLLKYKFAQLISLKKIHKDALEYYNPNSIEFLNQIFCIYTLENLAEIQPLLAKYKQTHFEVIKYLVQNGREIEKEPIGIILRKPQLLDFETKKFIFRNHPRLRKYNGRRVHIEVDRTHLFQGSYNQLMSRDVRELEGKIQVSFVNEPGYDAGGLKRQWFLLVSREIFNQNYALFQKSCSGSTYQPNPKSYINPDHLNYFKFIGRFIAKALVQRELIDAYFTRAFYKAVIGQELEFNDLQAQDYEFYKSMEWLKNNQIDEGIFTFSYIYDNFGNKVEKELVPGGKEIIVNQHNKKEYIEKYCMAKMREDFSSQLNRFLEGFHEVIPQECICYFQAKELELLISGVPQVDVEDMKKNTDYSGYNPADQIIVWFWQIVSEYSQEDLAKLVQFITGTSKIPVEGFSHLIGMNGIQRISIHRDPCEHQLPKSHTCFNQLDLPNYPSREVLKQKLGICLAWGSEGFGFM